MNKTKTNKLFIKTLVFIIFIILIFTLTSCKKETNLTVKNYRTGTDSLIISFLHESPPDIIYENDPNVYIGLSVKNKGASDIEKGIITIGRSEDYLLIDKFRFMGQEVKEPIMFDLAGRSNSIPYGGEFTLDMDAHTLDITLSKYQNTVLYIYACYDYQTILEHSVCIEPDRHLTQLKKEPCKAKDISPGTQGAPVNVKKVYVQSNTVTGNKIKNTFRIKVGNDKNGQVIAKGTSKQICTNEFSSTQDDPYKKVFNVVKVEGSLGKDKLKCKRDGIVTLDKDTKTGEISCEVITDHLSVYETNLVLKLDYGYQIYETKELKIKKI